MEERQKQKTSEQRKKKQTKPLSKIEPSYSSKALKTNGPSCFGLSRDRDIKSLFTVNLSFCVFKNS